MVPTRAYENGVYLAHANSAGVGNGIAYLGASVIAAPDGMELAQASNEPSSLYAVIEPERVAKAQERLPYLQDRNSLKLS